MGKRKGDPPAPELAPAASLGEIARQIAIYAPDPARFSRLRDTLHQRFGNDLAHVVAYEPAGLLLVGVKPTGSVAALVTFLAEAKADGLVALWEANRVLTPRAAVNDPRAADQWALQKIDAEAAWARAAVMPNVGRPVVAVVDSGVKRLHPDLQDHVGLGAGIDEDAHGTFLAGTIGAVTNNSEGVAGTFGPRPPAAPVPPIRLLDLKFFDHVNGPTSVNAAAQIFFAALLGVDVINASWDVGMPSPLLEQAIDFARLRNVIIVAAAGNDGSNNDDLPTWPACYDSPNVISVMATDEDDVRPAFSNYGKRTVHLAAPGVGILSTFAFLSKGTYQPKIKYRAYRGTSAAAAHVSGAAALLRALKPHWAAEEVRDHLLASVDRVPFLSCIADGRLNLGRAVCGAFSVTSPSAGDTWPRNALVEVLWDVHYATPAARTVRIVLEEGGAETTLAQSTGNDGHRHVRAPDRAIAQARLRIESRQAPFLFARSGTFAVA
jgi:subtilisin family serine protease